MRMSEFERPDNNQERNAPFFAGERPEVPDDFTDEDLAFAAELHTFFPLAEEGLPPYYVQTLLDIDDRRFEPVARRFEQRTSTHVFRHLNLNRSLFRTRTSPFCVLNTRLGDTSFRRTLLTIMATFLLLMLFTVAFTASSFASGLALLLHGSHENGAYLINRYPTGQIHAPRSAPPGPFGPTTRQISLFTAQQQLSCPLYWPEYTLPDYTLQNINFYVGLDQQWVDGPIIEFEYSLPPSANLAGGTGQLWVREFKPRTNVLELVKDDALTPIQVDNSGRAQAIYVNGQWNADGTDWIYGGRSELIYQINGVVFWIAGDQRNKVSQTELMQIAHGLSLYTATPRMSAPGDTMLVTQKIQDDAGPFSTDVILLPPGESGSEDGPYYISVTSSQPPKNTY